MSKKFYLITVAVTLIISAAIVFFFFNFSRNVSEETTQKISEKTKEGKYINLPIEELSQKSKLEIETGSGDVEINNVYKKLKEKLSKNGVAFEDNNDYYMAFYPQDNGFLIVINNADVISAGEKAEKNFMEQLGITKEQACKLKVSITVPYDVSEEYSGEVFGFSFCPDAEHIK